MVSEESLALFVQLTLSLFPLLETQHNVLARGLTLPSLGKRWPLAYKGGSYLAVNI